MKSQNGSIAFIISMLMVLVLGIGGGFYWFFYREGIDPLKDKRQVYDFNTTTSASGHTTRIKGDINDDGTITTVDAQLVQGQVDCISSDKCWSSVIGKTLSGDNPIYVSDLDMDGSGTITEEDVTFVNNNVTQ